MGSLTNYQKSLIIGTLLGDGYLRIIPGKFNAFLEINHSIKQKEYVDWKYAQLRNISGKEPMTRPGRNGRIAYRFYTRQSPYLTDLYNCFYTAGNKIIPQDLVLDPVTISVWFMDDGSRCRKSDLYLNTQQFNLKSQYGLIEKLRDSGIEARLNKDKEYRRIRILKSSIEKFEDIVRPHIIPCMEYKIGDDPVETTRRSPAPNRGWMKI